MESKGSQRSGLRQLTRARVLNSAIGLASALVLAGCAAKPDESQRGTVGFVRGFLGGVVADEPQAALVGREILSAGGSAVDAAVAAYFTLAVTLPSAATLGGGGICLVHDQAKGATEMLDFIAVAPASRAAGGVAVPANARGFYILHARYGRLKWPQILSPATNAARFGVRMPRALAADLAANGSTLADANLRRVFGRRDGVTPRAGGGPWIPLAEGEQLVQVDLAATIERIRNQGPGNLHQGAGAAMLAEAYQAAGLPLTREDLGGAAPVWRKPISLPVEIAGRRAIAHFAGPPASGGAVTAKIAGGLLENDRYVRAGADRLALFAELAGRAAAERAPQPSPADGFAATVIVAADSSGMAVVCAVTPNAPFGAGRMAPGTGLIAAAAPDASGRGPAALTAMLVQDRRGDGVYFAGGAAGGAAAATVLAQVAAETAAGRSLEDALAAARIHVGGRGGAGDTVYHEDHLDEAARRMLTGRGYRLGASPALGVVNALSCPGGLAEKPASCALRADTRGRGLAAGAN